MENFHIELSKRTYSPKRAFPSRELPLLEEFLLQENIIIYFFVYVITKKYQVAMYHIYPPIKMTSQPF